MYPYLRFELGIGLCVAFLQYMAIMQVLLTALLVLCCESTVRSVKRYLQEPEIARAVQMLEDGQSHTRAAGGLGVSRSVVARLWIRYRATGRYARYPRQGRSRCTTPDKTATFALLLWLRHRRETARALLMDCRATTGLRISPGRISDQRVRNRLHEDNLKSRRPTRCQQHRAARLAFARQHRNWQLRHWRTVLFTDESRFCISTCDRRVRVWGAPARTLYTV